MEQRKNTQDESSVIYRSLTTAKNGKAAMLVTAKDNRKRIKKENGRGLIKGNNLDYIAQFVQ